MASMREAFNITFKFLCVACIVGIFTALLTGAGEFFLQQLGSIFFFFFGGDLISEMAPIFSDVAFTVLSNTVPVAVTAMMFGYMPSQEQLQSDLISFVQYLFTFSSSSLTLVINESSGLSSNEVYNAAKLYLPTKISPKTRWLRLSKTEKQKNFAFSIEKHGEIVDIFEGIQLKWRYNCIKPLEKGSPEKKFFELSFNKEFKEKVSDSYLPHVLAEAKEIKEASKVVKIYNRDCPRGDDDTGFWGSMNLEHPATFNTLAMDEQLKKSIEDGLGRFVRRRHKEVGMAWKRMYLVCGPPGTGKSSLIAAMANHLKFDIYSMDLASIDSDPDLRNVLLSTTNRSILVIKNIDCSIHLTLSGILNILDGLWSSCGDEKVIVFTANHKDRLEPALLHAGRMGEPIDLSYCTSAAFRILASNCLGIKDHHRFGEIDSLIQSTKVTPAEVVGELIKNEGAEAALLGLVDFLKYKRSECDKTEEEVADTEKANSFKGDNEEKDIRAPENRRRGGQDSNTKTDGSG